MRSGNLFAGMHVSGNGKGEEVVETGGSREKDRWLPEKRVMYVTERMQFFTFWVIQVVFLTDCNRNNRFLGYFSPNICIFNLFSYL